MVPISIAESNSGKHFRGWADMSGLQTCYIEYTHKIKKERVISIDLKGREK